MQYTHLSCTFIYEVRINMHAHWGEVIACSSAVSAVCELFIPISGSIQDNHLKSVSGWSSPVVLFYLWNLHISNWFTKQKFISFRVRYARSLEIWIIFFLSFVHLCIMNVWRRNYFNWANLTFLWCLYEMLQNEWCQRMRTHMRKPQNAYLPIMWLEWNQSNHVHITFTCVKKLIINHKTITT